MEFRIAGNSGASDKSGTESRQNHGLFDLQLNPISPGMGFHRPERARDVNFWVARLSTPPIALKAIGHSTFPSRKKQSTWPWKIS